MIPFPWVLINKLSDATGYTDDAVRAKIKRGHWVMGIHFTKAPDGRLLFNLEAIRKWIERKE
ncbi:MAG: excisionase family protein [Burkholderiales bacterium]|nr:excisionase family protein [Burkholderiales bacterium]